MTMTPGEILFVDTNVLLAATVTGRQEHNEALELLKEATEHGVHLAASGQILREYLVVATRPTERNGLGLSVRSAVYNIHQFKRVLVLHPEGEAVTETLLSLLSSYGVTGRHIHDANIVALMRVHAISTLVTINWSDFSKFDWLTLLTPADALSALPG